MSERERGEIVIPEFKDVREIARFWETHSLADFEDELEDADDVEFIRPGTRVISVKLKETEFEKLSRLAKKKGVNRASLVRTWVKENLKREGL